MFIDYLTLMLLNLVVGLVLLAFFIARHLETNTKRMIPGFLAVGFIALVTGTHIIFTWPLPGSYNIPFGEMSVLFGVLFLGAGIAIWKEWDLFSLMIYALFAGLASMLVGVRMYTLKMTSQPILAVIGFILTGLSGVLSVPVYYLKSNKVLRIIVVLVILAAATIWAVTGYGAYWSHLEGFSKWKIPAQG